MDVKFQATAYHRSQYEWKNPKIIYNTSVLEYKRDKVVAFILHLYNLFKRNTPSNVPTFTVIRVVQTQSGSECGEQLAHMKPGPS